MLKETVKKFKMNIQNIIFINLINIHSLKLISMFILKHISLLKNSAVFFLLLSKILNLKFTFIGFIYLFITYYFSFLNRVLKKRRKLQALHFIKNLKYFFFKGYKLKYFYLNIFKELSDYYCIIKIIFRSHNIFINIINILGKNIKFYSSGFFNFKGREKTTLLACKELGKNVIKFIEEYFTYVEIQFIGKRGYIRPFIESLFLKNKLKLTRIFIMDKIPHSGCRLKKKSRK